jgi:hypothetical protein
MLQLYKDFVEITFGQELSEKFTKSLSELHTFVIFVVYDGRKMRGESDDENTTE